MEQRVDDYFVILFYETARHRIYVELLLDKSSNSTLNAYENFYKYITELPDQFVEVIITDQGNEF